MTDISDIDLATVGDGNPKLVTIGDLLFSVSANGLEAETCGLIFRFTEPVFTQAWMKSMARELS